MIPVPSFRDPRLSLWQSSVAAVVHRRLDAAGPEGVAEVNRHEVMQAANRAAVPHGSHRLVAAIAPLSIRPTWFDKVRMAVSRFVDKLLGRSSTPSPAVETCADLYLKLALTVDPAARRQLQQQIIAFGSCDPLWAEALVEYETNVKILAQPVPYIKPTGPDDAVFETLPARATIGLLSDWGTGTPESIELLKLLAAHRQPGVPFFLIHLGDVYYSGTAREMERFVANCRSVLGPDVPIFTLAGNHDMYAGGRPYYDAIATLNPAPLAQRTSYFTLRNEHWQFQAMDTGLNDRDPRTVNADTTFLDPAEARWHREQLARAGDRKVVLLSHHQPFSAFASIGSGSTNDRLLAVFNGSGADAGPNYLDRVALWLWGHEHILVFYDPHAGVARGRCIGSGAIPVLSSDDPYKVLFADIPFDQAAISDNDGTVYAHGYAIMEIDGPAGRVEYFQAPDPRGRNPLVVDQFDGP